jgi:hypothetical protein
VVLMEEDVRANEQVGLNHTLLSRSECVNCINTQQICIFL